MKKLFSFLASSSVLWGFVATFLFYSAINAGFIHNETIVRYCAGHPVEYATTAMFWIGLFDLLFKLAHTRRERSSLKRGALFPPKRKEKESASRVVDYLETTSKAREVRGNSEYLQRLNDALVFLERGGSPDDLDQELRLLADDAWERRDGEYGLVRTFIWAIPILGFLGTVLGITVALGSLDLTQLESTGETLAAGLKVAFDTTALALSLVFVLYFLQFFSRKQDAVLANGVSKLVDSELRGRFIAESELGSRQDEVESTRRFLKSIADSFEETIRKQADAWIDATSNAARESAKTSLETAERLGEALNKRLDEGGVSWTQALVQTQKTFVETTLAPALEASAQSAARLDALELQIASQTEALSETLRATADVVALEERLTETLERIGEVGEFEKTLSALSATVCLLNAKLASTVPSASSGLPLRGIDATRRPTSKKTETTFPSAAMQDSSSESRSEDLQNVREVNSTPLVFHNFDASTLDDAKGESSVPTMPILQEADQASSCRPKSERTRQTLGKKRSA